MKNLFIILFITIFIVSCSDTRHVKVRKVGTTIKRVVTIEKEYSVGDTIVLDRNSYEPDLYVIDTIY